MGKQPTVTVHVKAQHSVGSSRGFGGPDTYVAVTIAPAGVETPKVLNADLLKRRSIEYIWVGEGYRRSQGPRSALGKAIMRANEIAAHERADLASGTVAVA